MYVIYTSFNVATNNVKIMKLFFCKKKTKTQNVIELTSFFAVVNDHVSTLVEKYIF